MISEEFSDWEDSRRRIDLLAIDKQANLVVIELKRDEQLISSQKKEKDYTWYIYKDKELNKRKLALELLRDWINQFNPASYNDLINGLSDDFKKRTVMLIDQIPEKQKSRYHINEDALITLPSGEIVAISNQWGIVNIELLIEFVRQNGFVVEKAEQ